MIPIINISASSPNNIGFLKLCRCIVFKLFIGKKHDIGCFQEKNNEANANQERDCLEAIYRKRT